MAAPSHRLRFLVGLALGAGLAVWLARSFLAEARRDVADERQARQAVVALQALSSLVRHSGEDGDAARRLAAAWQAATPGVTQLRLAQGTRLEISTAPDDTGERAAPRRLAREEKALYDRAQRIAGAVQTNRDEQQGLKAELEVEPIAGGRLSLAGPAEGAGLGLLELETAPGPPAPAVGWGAFLLALLAPLAAFALLSLLLGQRRAPLAAAAAVCLVASLLLLFRHAAGVAEADRRQAASAVAERVREQAVLTRALATAQGWAPATAPGDWDADAYRKPRGELAPDGTLVAARVDAAAAALGGALWRSMLAGGALGLALLLLTGLGALHRVGATLKKNRQAYAYIAPAILGMLLLVFYPFLYGITLSFTDSNIYNTNKHFFEIWTGLANYADILRDFSFAKRVEGSLVFNYLNFYWTLLFTVIWTVTNVAIGVSSGLLLALILNTRSLAFRPIYRVLFILPWAMPTYICALIWKGMFHRQFGVINQVLVMLGMGPVSWFDRPFTSFLAALTTNAWLSFPFMMVVSLGALQSIPADLYEAARVDGASRWQQFRAITLPSLRPALVPAVILSVVWTFNQFNVIYLVTAGDPGGATEILITQAYKFAFERYRYGYAAAYSTVIFGILLVYGILQNRYSRATEA